MSLSNKSAHVSSVIAALGVSEHPLYHLRVRPDEMASETAVCRISCAVTRGNVESASGQRGPL
jgi:hypothetical protein